MTEHYFSKKPQAKSAPRTWRAKLRGKQFSFTSDVGVFSRQGVDFGTRLLIEHFVEPPLAGDLLDLGCGYGPIGLAIAHQFSHRHIIMADINERALTLAKENAKANNITNVSIIQSDSFNNIGGKFAAILSNPPIRAGKKIVYKMFEESKDALLERGELWIVIQKKQGALSAKKKLEELFEKVELIVRKKGYHVFKAEKPLIYIS